MSRVLTNIHASCVTIGGKGVLLLGPSGAGKSDLALRLVDDGARLVADDACEIFVQGNKLFARAPASIAGLMELRGIGIIAMPFAKSAMIALVVQLRTRPAPRLPEPCFYQPPAGLKAGPIPLIMVNGRHASATARIRAALASFSRARFRDSFNVE